MVRTRVALAFLVPCLALVVPAALAPAEEDVKTGAVEYREGETVLEGWLAAPAGDAKRPGVLVFHAWRGLDAHARESADRLARMGYVALAADVYGKGVRPQA